MKTSTSLSASDHHSLIQGVYPQILTWRIDFQNETIKIRAKRSTYHTRRKILEESLVS